MLLSFNNAFNQKYNQYEPLVEHLTKKTFKILKIANNYVVELNFVDNKTIQAINKMYRNIDKPTDVLSFAFLELADDEIKIKSKQPQILGEVDISIEKVAYQAKQYKHSFKYELAYLCVHGLLHLLGYDHVHNSAEERIMFNLQKKILKGENL